ncbi:MAG: HNH endonuclease [Alphaproteobacteria bacterium]|nr:HNH endonuclease [Alphaproteobacteria bacterium]
MMTEFSLDDAGYRRWLTAHPSGWVANVDRGKSSYLKIHVATCRWAASANAPVSPNPLTNDYIKVVSDSFDELWSWAQARGFPAVGRGDAMCGVCGRGTAKPRSSPTLAPMNDETAFFHVMRRLYGEACAVTGPCPEVALDVVAIDLDAGHVVENGLLLRSDIRRLFDAGMLVVEPGGRIKVSPLLVMGDYQRYDGRKLRPRLDGSQPAPEYIQARLRGGYGGA